MTLKNLNDKNELINMINIYKNLKNEFLNELPKLLEDKKEELKDLITKIQSCECYQEEASAEEKKEFTDLLNQLNS